MMKKLDLVKLLLDFLVHLIFLFVDEIVVAIDVVKHIETVDYNFYYYNFVDDDDVELFVVDEFIFKPQILSDFC
jgi:hypothetical protein